VELRLFAKHPGGFCVGFHLLGLILCQGLVDLFGNNLQDRLVDLPLTVSSEPSIGARNPVEEEEDVEDNGS
jgi:hypothetical protein